MRLPDTVFCWCLLSCIVDTGQPASTPGDMPLTAQTADVLSAYSAEQGDLSWHPQMQRCCTCYGCKESAQSHLTTLLCALGFKEITVDKLSELRGADGSGIALLDVRTPEEYGEQPLKCPFVSCTLSCCGCRATRHCRSGSASVLA